MVHVTVTGEGKRRGLLIRTGSPAVMDEELQDAGR